MSDILIEVESGKSKRLKTANKVCAEDIIVTGTSDDLDLFRYVRFVDFSVDLREITEDITLHLERAPSLSGLFALSRTINAPKITIYIGDSCVDISRAFAGNGQTEGLKTIEIIGDTSKITTFNRTFYWRIALEEIICELDFSSASDVNSMFAYSSTLKEVRFKPNTLSLSISFAQCSSLSTESVDSIIDGLADLTGGTAQTLTVYPNIKVMIEHDPERLAKVTGKNWNLA